MRKWRPAHKCIYVIPEIHGNAFSLEVILNRILPLRIFKNQEDILVFLGDYIDGHENGTDVIDMLINIKNEYSDRVFFLKGNHEDLMLRAIFGSEIDYNSWINFNGNSTIIGYNKKYGKNILGSGKTQLSQLIPESHVKFLQSLDSFKIIDEYFFMHGSFDYNKKISENSVNNFIYDYTASKYIKECVSKQSDLILLDDYIFVGAHNFNARNKIFIHPRYFMLGGTAPSKLIVFELNSMAASAVSQSKSKMHKYNFDVFE